MNITTLERVPKDASGTTDRVLDVLTACVSAGEPVGVSDLARQLALSKAVVFRILRSLTDRGFLTYVDSTRRYALGPLALQLGARMLASADIRTVALPIMQQLRDESDESVALGLLVNGHNTYIEQIPSRQEVRMIVDLGTPFPLHRGAQGKVTLAFCRPALRDDVLDRLPRDVDRPTLEAALMDIREQRSAVSMGERVAGAAAVAAPLLGLDGFANGSIAICGPRSRFDSVRVARYRKLVVAASERITNLQSGQVSRLAARSGS